MEITLIFLKQEEEVQLPAPDSDPLVGDVIDEEAGSSEPNHYGRTSCETSTGKKAQHVPTGMLCAATMKKWGQLQRESCAVPNKPLLKNGSHRQRVKDAARQQLVVQDRQSQSHRAHSTSFHAAAGAVGSSVGIDGAGAQTAACTTTSQYLRQLRCCRRAARLKILPPVWCCTAVKKYLLFFLVPDPIGMQSGRCAPRMRRGCSEARVLV